MPLRLQKLKESDSKRKHLPNQSVLDWLKKLVSLLRLPKPKDKQRLSSRKSRRRETANKTSANKKGSSEARAVQVRRVIRLMMRDALNISVQNASLER